MTHPLSLLQTTVSTKVSDGTIAPPISSLLDKPLLVLVLSQLGDFDSLEYAWWLQKDAELVKDLEIVAVGIGDRRPFKHIR